VSQTHCRGRVSGVASRTGVCTVMRRDGPSGAVRLARNSSLILAGSSQTSYAARPPSSVLRPPSPGPVWPQASRAKTSNRIAIPHLDTTRHDTTRLDSILAAPSNNVHPHHSSSPSPSPSPSPSLPEPPHGHVAAVELFLPIIPLAHLSGLAL
jgi:hypothetical protein